MKTKAVLANKIAKAILKDVTDRRGWSQAYDTFDHDVREEIHNSWVFLIEQQLFQHEKK